MISFQLITRDWFFARGSDAAAGSFKDAAYTGDVIVLAAKWQDGALKNALNLRQIWFYENHWTHAFKINLNFIFLIQFTIFTKRFYLIIYVQSTTQQF